MAIRYAAVIISWGVLFIAPLYGDASNVYAATVEECYANVEDIKMTLEGDNVPPSVFDAIRDKLTQAVYACDQNDAAAGMGYLAQANALYAEYDAQRQRESGLSDSDFWQQVTSVWGNSSPPDSIHKLKGLFSCDDQEDYIGWRLSRSQGGQWLLDVMAIAKDEDGRLQAASMTLPYNDGSLYGLCSPAEDVQPPNVTLAPASVALLQEVGDIDICQDVVTIDDGMCDKVYLFWPRNAASSDVPFVPFRR